MHSQFASVAIARGPGQISTHTPCCIQGSGSHSIVFWWGGTPPLLVLCCRDWSQFCIHCLAAAAVQMSPHSITSLAWGPWVLLFWCRGQMPHSPCCSYTIVLHKGTLFFVFLNNYHSTNMCTKCSLGPSKYTNKGTMKSNA